MSPDSPSAFATEIAFRFVRELQAGKNPRIEDAVALAPPNEWDSILHSLLIAEVNFRRAGGEVPQLREYLNRFPNHAAIVKSVLPESIVVAPSVPVPVAQFLAPPQPVAESVPTEHHSEPTTVFNKAPIPQHSTRHVWLFMVGGAFIAVLGCVAVIMSLLPKSTPKTDPEVVNNNDQPTTKQKAKEGPSTVMSDPERATAEFVLSVGGHGSLQTSKGKVSLASTVELPKGAFTIEAITLPASAANKWKEEDLAQLANRKQINFLDLTHPTALTPTALANIAKLPLQTLELRGPDVRITGAILSELTNLERLTLLSAPSFSDADTAALAKLEKLHTFKINSPKITSAGMAHLNKLPLLRSLTFGADCTLSPDHIRLIQSIPLEDFTSLGGMSDEVFAECAVFVNLKRCFLQQTSLNDAGFKAFAGMRKLEELRVLGCGISGEGFKPLTEIKTLHTIEIRGAKVTNDAFEAIDQLPALKELRLVGSLITDKGAEKLANVDSLEILDLSDCKITDQTLNFLNKHAKLKSLLIQRTGVTMKGVDAFRKANPKCNVVWK